MSPEEGPGRTALHLARWSVTSGSNVRSRGIVVLDAGEHHWQGSAEGNGAVDALFKAVDSALAPLLSGHPRLVGYEVAALAEGPDAEGRVSIRIRPPVGAPGERGTGEYSGGSSGTNIIAASIEAYVEALDAMLGAPSWAAAPTEAGSTRRKRQPHGRRGEFDAEKGVPDTTAWFES